MASALKIGTIFAVGAVCGVAGMAVMSMSSDVDRQSPLVEVPAAVPAQEVSGDQRIAILLSEGEQLHVRDQMLSFLNGLATINDAALTGDREAIRATALRLQRGDGGGQSIRQKVPDGFTQISRGLRSDFGAIADMALEADMADIQRATTETLYRCSACHGTYRLEIESGD